MAVQNVLLTTYFDSMGVGGLSTHMRALRQGLLTRGIRVEVVDARVRRALPTVSTLIRSMGSRDRYRVAMTLQAQHELAAALEQQVVCLRPDVIHAHDIYALAALKRVRTALPPIVLTVHGPALNEATMSGIAPPGSRMHHFLDEMESQAMQRANHIIAVDALQKELAMRRTMSDHAISVVHNAVDPSIFEHPLGPSDGNYLLVPRRLVPKNGVSVAIEAFSVILKRHPGVHLWLAGAGPLRAQLQALTASLAVQANVRFLGDVPHEDMPRLYAQALAVLIPSVPADGVVEATSLAALEGMASGRPVVASRIGGLAEMIVDGQTGILFPAGDAASLADHLERLLSSERLRHRLGQAAKLAVRERFSADAWMENIIQIYQQAQHNFAASIAPGAPGI